MVGLLTMDDLWRRNQKTGPITMSELGAAGIGSAPQGAPAPQRRGFLGGFFGPDGRDMRQRLAIGLEGMTLNPNQALIQTLQGDMEARKAGEVNNRTVAWLKSLGTPQAAQAAAALEAGAIDAGNAVQFALKPVEQDEGTALMQNYEYAKRNGFTGTFTEFMRSGGGGGSVVNVGGNGIDYGTPPKDMAWVRNPDGTVKLDERGVPMALPIQNTQLATDAAVAADKADQKAENTATYNDAALRTIDRLLGGVDPETGEKIPAMLKDPAQRGYLDLPEAGIVGSALAGFGVNQEAVNVKNALTTIGSSIAFDRLQAMRDASATGGALGSVTERELGMLIDSLGSISQDNDPVILRQNLENIRNIWRKIQSDPVARRAYAAAGATGAAGAAAAASQGGGDFSVTDQF